MTRNIRPQYFQTLTAMITLTFTMQNATAVTFPANDTGPQNHISSTKGPVYVENLGRVYLTHQTAILHMAIQIKHPKSLLLLLTTLQQDIQHYQESNHTLLKTDAAKQTIQDLWTLADEITATFRDIVPYKTRQ